jgi:nitrogen fixation NifU-like protein
MNYSKEVLDHFQNPRNVGEIKNADGVGKVGNIACGDVMWIYIKVEEKNNKKIIKDIKFKTFGCVAALSTSSVLTEIVKGKSFEEALKVQKKDIVKKLGGLPDIKIHCSFLAIEALWEAIYDYLSNEKLEIPEKVKINHQKVLKSLKIIKEKNK